jgi:hypothetical protein
MDWIGREQMYPVPHSDEGTQALVLLGMIVLRAL